MKRDFTTERLDAALAKCERDQSGKVIESTLTVEAIEIADQLIAVNAELDNVQRALIYPAFIRAAVKEFNDELTYEGQPATADLLCEHGPDDLFVEVVKAINGNGYLSKGQVENLSSPTTSVAAVDGTTTSTNATPVSNAPDSPASAAA